MICTQEMDQLREQFGPFTEDQEVALETLSAHISQRISAALARQLKEMPGHNELTGALQQLFQLDVAKPKAKPRPAISFPGWPSAAQVVLLCLS